MSILFSHFFQKNNKIAPLEHEFTEVLDTIALKPKMLYFHGKLPQNVSKKRPPVVAIVGSRHGTKYGEEVAYKLAHELGRRGAIVVSGLAFGIDSIGHRGCLDAGGITVAVLGTPIDQIYPRNHLGLAQEIIEKGGAIISEYASDTDLAAPVAPGEAVFDGFNWYNHKANPPQQILRRQTDRKLSFLYRNRLISGLSDIVVVVEAAERSGTLNTASHALSQGKEVFAVPGNITSPYSRGCNKLIAQGAFPYSEPDDILRLLFPEEFIKKSKKLHHLTGDNDVETLILRSLGNGLRSGDDIMANTKLPPEVFNQSITMLELSGRVRTLGANNWGLS